MSMNKQSLIFSPKFNDIKTFVSPRMVHAAIEGNILTAAKGKSQRTFLLTSSISGEGKTFTSLVMAQALASHSNAKVLLIEGNVHNPNLTQAFDVQAKEVGMFEYFSSDKLVDEFIVYSGHENIFLMPLSNKKTPNADRCFHHELFASQLEKLKNTSFDYILLDGCAVMGFSDTLAIAKFFDSTILIIECEKTKWEVVQLASEKLAMVKANQLGTILNKRSYPIPRKFYN